MKKYLYRVKFLIKRGGKRYYVIDLAADNAKEAKEEAKKMWYNDHSNHMFNIEVRRLNDTEEFKYNYFKQTA